MTMEWKKEFPRFYLKRELRGETLRLAAAPEPDQFNNYLITCSLELPGGKTKLIKTKCTMIDMTKILDLDDQNLSFTFVADATNQAFTNVVRKA